MTFKKTEPSTSSNYIIDEMTSDLVESIVGKIKDIFVDVGPVIVQNAGTNDFITKQDGSPVTELDGQIEVEIIKQLNASFPRLVVFGEESGYSENLPEVCVLIDPIDGTSSFIKNIPSYTCMAVLICDKEAIASVIYNPKTKKMFVAIKDKGSFLNDTKLDLRTTNLPSVANCKTKDVRDLNIILSDKKVECMAAPTGAGDGFSKVAEGTTAARFQINAGGYIHDYAPGALLVSEAGGILIPIKEDKYNFKSRSFVACHPDLKDLINQHIDKIKKLEFNR